MTAVGQGNSSGEAESAKADPGICEGRSIDVYESFHAEEACTGEARKLIEDRPLPM